MTQWVVRNRDGQFCLGSGPDPANYLSDPVNYSLVDTGAVDTPDPETQRWDGTAVVAKSAADIESYRAAHRAQQFLVTSRQRDLLATCALIVRARGIPAWTTMSLQQKRDATLAEADAWVGIRAFIEDHL